MKTRLTEVLGIQYPIIQGGMQHIAKPVLAAAVSNAGAMGTISTTIYPTPEEFSDALQEMNSLTDKPYCVNMSLLPDVSVGDDIARMIQICADAGVRAIETSGVKPDKISGLIREAGIYHIHKVPATRFAVSAQKCGVNAVSVVGYDCGGHPGMDGIGTIVLINESSRTLDIPVIAGGGIVDGRGIAAALMLGADAVIMGTRFIATKEAPVSDNHKQWILEAGEKSTVLAQKSIRNAVRVANNEAARKCIELEKQGAGLKELLPVIKGANGKEAYRTGNVDLGLFPISTACGLIHDVPTVKELIDSMVAEARACAGKLTQTLE